MKKTILFVLLFSVVSYCNAQTKAVTENGDEVLLYSDGTWKYVSDTKKETKILDTVEMAKPASSSFLLKSKKIKCGIWINSSKWKFNKEDDADGVQEYSFTLFGEDAYAMFIPERIEIPLETWETVAVENAKKVATDVEIIKEQIRIVNKVPLLCIQMNCTIHGIKFTYYGYYYSSEKGSAQFITYTSQSLFSQYKPQLENLLNGLVILSE